MYSLVVTYTSGVYVFRVRLVVSLVGAGGCVTCLICLILGH